jgi:hypothetical protein
VDAGSAAGELDVPPDLRRGVEMEPAPRRRKRQAFRGRGSEKGKSRRALIGMSDKGPSGGDPSGLGTGPWSGGPPLRPVLVTLPVDPVSSSDPGGPVTWPPRLPPSTLGDRRTDLRLRPIPPFPEEVRGRSSKPANPTPQGFSVPNLHILRVPARRPQQSPRPSTGSGRLSTGRAPGCGPLVRTSLPQPRTVSKAAATSSSRRSSPNGATICTPTGSPSVARPAGTEMAGQPVTVIT